MGDIQLFILKVATICIVLRNLFEENRQLISSGNEGV